MQPLKLILAIVLISQQTFSQEIVTADIQYVQLNDTIAENIISDIIKERNTTDTLFAKGIGYLDLWTDTRTRHGKELKDHTRIDTVYQISISINFMHPEKEQNTLADLYPSYYTFVDNRLVTIGNGEEPKFTEKSKQLYRNMINNYLEPFGSPSRRLMDLGSITRIYYLKNRFTGEKYVSVVPPN